MAGNLRTTARTTARELFIKLASRERKKKMRKDGKKQKEAYQKWSNNGQLQKELETERKCRRKKEIQ